MREFFFVLILQLTQSRDQALIPIVGPAQSVRYNTKEKDLGTSLCGGNSYEKTEQDGNDSHSRYLVLLIQLAPIEQQGLQIPRLSF